MHNLIRATLLLLAGVGAAAADEAKVTDQDLPNLMRVKLRTVQHMALNPVLVTAVREQNRERLPLAEVKRRDEDWTGNAGLTDMKRRLMSGPAARLLRETVADGTVFTEAFLTDNQGANVAVYPPTSDYWQGDEEKWTASWAGGEGRMFVGELEFDESTDRYAVQISAPVKDGPDTIGVLVVGVSIDYVSGRH